MVEVKDYSFALPDALGWDCNDEIKDFLKKLFERYAEVIDNTAKRDIEFIQDMFIAEITDGVYNVIKRYQDSNGNV